ncbi:MAG: DUF805 domain-containing protein [Anaplasmataceae bacterium]|nr:DUF805 domain-containing protein [Anaplasmataceae bacterium]
MNYQDTYIGVLKKYAVFDGRAGREEFWTFTLINLAINVVLNVLSGVIGIIFSMIGMIFGLAVLIPGLAVGVRRLHDIGKSGWWILIGFIPVLGWIVLLIFALMKGESGSNQYGPNPTDTTTPNTPQPASMPPQNTSL